MRDDFLQVEDGLWDFDTKVTNYFAEINDKVEDIDRKVEDINVKADQIKAAIETVIQKQQTQITFMSQMFIQNSRVERKIDRIEAIIEARLTELMQL